MSRLSNICVNILKVFIVLDLVALCLILFLNIMSRLFFHSLIWSMELANFLFVYLIFLGAIISLKNKKHFRVDLLINILPNNFKKIVELINNLIILLILYIFVSHSMDLVYSNWQSTTTVLHIPYAMYYLLGIIAGAPMFLIVLIDTYYIFKQKHNKNIEV